MEKIVIIINGTGCAGKDTLCEIAAKYFRVKIISAIDPIKGIAETYGWNGEKDAKARKFLSDLKQIFVEYNDLPTEYLYNQYKLFLEAEEDILFVHIREGKEIDKFKKLVNIKCVTLLIDRNIGDNQEWGNSSDDNVRNYNYDYYYMNEKNLELAEKEFIELLESINEC